MYLITLQFPKIYSKMETLRNCTLARFFDSLIGYIFGHLASAAGGHGPVRCDNFIFKTTLKAAKEFP